MRALAAQRRVLIPVCSSATARAPLVPRPHCTACRRAAREPDDVFCAGRRACVVGEVFSHMTSFPQPAFLQTGAQMGAASKDAGTRPAWLLLAVLVASQFAGGAAQCGANSVGAGYNSTGAQPGSANGGLQFQIKAQNDITLTGFSWQSAFASLCSAFPTGLCQRADARFCSACCHQRHHQSAGLQRVCAVSCWEHRAGSQRQRHLPRGPLQVERANQQFAGDHRRRRGHHPRRREPVHAGGDERLAVVLLQRAQEAWVDA